MTETTVETEWDYAVRVVARHIRRNDGRPKAMYKISDEISEGQSGVGGSLAGAVMEHMIDNGQLEYLPDTFEVQLPHSSGS